MRSSLTFTETRLRCHQDTLRAEGRRDDRPQNDRASFTAVVGRCPYLCSDVWVEEMPFEERGGSHACVGRPPKRVSVGGDDIDLIIKD